MRDRIALFMAGLGVATMLAGCTKEEDPVIQKEPMPSIGKSGGSVATPGRDPKEMAEAHQDKGGGASKADLAKLEKEKDALKVAFEKAPNDAKAKEAFIKKTVELGTATMMAGDELTPKEKYGGARKFYREALKVDPDNEEATNNKKMIEDIYKQMGRPIPE